VGAGRVAVEVDVRLASEVGELARVGKGLGTRISDVAVCVWTGSGVSVNKGA
jgi:hypothetical protein